MNLNMNIKMQQVLQIHDNDTNQNYFLIENDGEWVKLTQDEYKNIIRGKK